MILGCRPVSSRTSSAMCSVPPGPSPGSPSQRVMKETFCNPMRERRVEHPAIAAVVYLTPSGAVLSSSGITNTAGAGLSLTARSSLPAMVGIGEGDGLGQEFRLVPRKAQLDPHAALEAGLGEQQVAAARAAAHAEIACAGAELSSAADRGHRVSLRGGKRAGWPCPVRERRDRRSCDR